MDVWLIFSLKTTEIHQVWFGGGGGNVCARCWLVLCVGAVSRRSRMLETHFRTEPNCESVVSQWSVEFASRSVRLAL